eukprot:TRINITY_DN3476_c0_g1_i1.p1 TRINITY_DN3476_c0_g1~~TRINITY_DN3476_c0_g1_i1.p1  ORF type:complete len:259 (+),score=90.52 TRINITY_DN3476_c0_g1_i1:211-987(+)
MFKGAKKDKDEKRKLKEFKEVTGASEDVAKEILKNFPNLDAALDHYFANTQLYNKKGTSTKQIDKSKLEDIFAKFATEEPDALFDESLRTYVTAIGVDPAHRNALYVFYKLGAKNAGELTKDEFVNGWISYGVDTLDGMTAEAAKSEAEMQNEPDFRDFYKWIFNYLKENKKSRTIPKGLGLALWSICLDPVKFPLLVSFRDFLNTYDVDVFTRDLWEQGYEFLRDMDLGLTKYDPEGAWPFVVDEFVKSHKNAEKKQ